MILKDVSGKNLNAGPPWKSDSDPDLDSLAAVPFLADQDGDGDLDLLVGNIQGHVILIPNGGTARKPSFEGSQRRRLEAGGRPILVQGDSGPCVADWDSDGAPDLLVGSGDGAVWLFRNIGSKEKPEYSAGTSLLPKAERAWNAVPNGGEPEGPGLRTKVAVADWNGDGRPDLLVGDFWQKQAPERKLTEAETARRDELKRRQKEVSTAYSDLHQKLGDKRDADPEFRKVSEELRAIHRELERLEPRPTPQGSVWLFLRKKPETP